MYIDPTVTASPCENKVETDSEALAFMCKALGHPVRITILRHLLEEDRCICGRIVEVLPLAQSTVSQHLKILKESGLVQGEVEGPKTCYCVNRENLKKMLTTLSALFNQLNTR